jgi:TPR repeat protein
MGLLYLTGESPTISKNPIEAFRWLKRSADQGYPKGQCELGGC